MLKQLEGKRSKVQGKSEERDGALRLRFRIFDF